jgi:hypothetical protein
MENQKILEMVTKALPQLQSEIKRIAGIELKLSAILQKTDYYDYSIRIQSADFANQLDGFAASLFEEVKFKTWGGRISDNRELCFFPKIEFSGWGGGSNGMDYIWNTIWFNTESGQFIFSDEMKIYKQSNHGN